MMEAVSTTTAPVSRATSTLDFDALAKSVRTTFDAVMAEDRSCFS